MTYFVDVEQLRRKRYEKFDAAQAILNTAKSEKRNMTQSEKDEFYRLKVEIEEENKEISRIEEEQQRALTGGKPVEEFEGGFNMTERTERPIYGPEYRNIFKKTQVHNAGFRSFGEFLQVLASGRYDERLAKRDQLQIGDSELGGYAVPTEFGEFILDGALEEEIVRPRATVFEMNSHKRKAPMWDNLDRSGNDLFGGVAAQWASELEEKSDQTPKVREIELEAHKLVLYVSASREVLQDAGELENELTRAMRRTLAYEMDNAFLNGTGNGQPQGILNADALLSVERDEDEKVTYDDISRMYSKLVKDGGTGIWIINHSVLPELMQLKDEADKLIWIPNAREGSPGQLLGMPIYLTEKTPELGNTGDVLLCDLNRYFVGMRQEVALDVSQAPGWYRDYTSFRVVARVAGKPSWDKKLTLADGSTEMSAFVALDEYTS